MMQDVTELRELITHAARTGEIDRPKLKEQIKLLLGGSWFGDTYYDEAWNMECHILDNNPGQHIKKRAQAEQDAEQFLVLLGL